MDTRKKTILKTVLLSSIITAAVVYVALQSRLLRPDTSRPPDMTRAFAPDSTVPRGMSEEEATNVDVYEKYSAGVVNITSTTVAYDFFLQPVPTESGTGSGVVINDDGYIVTNFHVIEGARKLEVTLADRTKHAAEVIGVDANNDLAVLKINAGKSRLVPIPLGESTGLRVGQKVLAIGNPYGLQRTLTTGIISSLGREIESRNGRIIEDVIQTDAAINPGNSGGPLLNTTGQMIGLNTAILSPLNPGNTGIGFAIPAATIRRVAGDLVAYGEVRRPYLGIRSVGLSDYPGLSQGLGLSTNAGLLILAIEPDSPADRAGIRGPSQELVVGNYRVPAGGDVILAVQGHRIDTTEHLSSAIDQYRPGDRVTITVLRENRELDVPIVLQDSPNPTR